ncbi:MAG: patatin-like phospholipase family protein [Bradymonadia bacterium]
MTNHTNRPTLREWLEQTPFTLSLSAGFFGFYAHAGLVSVLEEEKLTPQAITGCSAGALIGGIWSSGTKIGTVTDFLFALDRNDFWDPGFGAGLLQGQRFDDLLTPLLGCHRIEDCPVSLHITAFKLHPMGTHYLSKGPLSDAIRASCAFPGLFHPVRFEGSRYLDGGIRDRSSLGAVNDDTPTLYHHLPSRSLVRRQLSAFSDIHRRSKTITISTAGLPRLSPFKLELGRQAFEHARHAFKAQLDKECHLP